MLQRLVVLLALAIATSAYASRDDWEHSWDLNLGGTYDSNIGMASNPDPQHGAGAFVTGSAGLSFDKYLSAEGSNFVAANFGGDLELRASTIADNLSQAIPDVWISVNVAQDGWAFGATLTGAYHFWGSTQANAIEPSLDLTVHFPSLINSGGAVLVAWVAYDLEDRISRADDPAMQPVYNGMLHTGTLALVLTCLGEEGCPSLIPDRFDLRYSFSAGDVVSVGPPSAEAAAVAKASAASNLFDSSSALGYEAYRLGATEHTFRARIWFTLRPEWRLASFAQYEHVILLDGAFHASSDRYSAGIAF